MFCRKCQYEVRGVESGQCPECARPFDAANPRTYDVVRPARKTAVAVLVATFAVIMVVRVWFATMSVVSVGWFRTGDGFTFPYVTAGLAMMLVGALCSGWFACRRAELLIYGGVAFFWLLPSLTPALHDWSLSAEMIGLIILAGALACAAWGAGRLAWSAHTLMMRRGWVVRRPRWWPRPRTIVITVVALVFTVFAWTVVETLRVMYGTPQVSVNYSARLNEMCASAVDVDPAEAIEAWTALEKLLFDASAAVTEAAEAYQATDYTQRSQSDNGWVDFTYVRLGAEPPPDVEREQRAIATLRAANIFDRLAAVNAGPTPIQPAAGIGVPLMVPNPGFGDPTRDLTEARAASMRLATARREFDEVARAFDELMGLARTISSQGTIIPHLVAAANHTIACAELATDLGDAPFPPDVCARLLETLDARRLASLELALEGERWVLHDAVQRVFTDNGRGDGYIVPKALAFVLVSPGSGPFSEFFTAFKARFHLASRRATTEEIDRLIDGRIEAVRRFPHDRATGNRPAPEDLEDPAQFLLALYIPAIDRVIANNGYVRQRTEALRILLAIEIFTAKHGHPPPTLAALAPGVLDAVPTDPRSGAPFGYRRLEEDANGRSFSLYAVGPDGIDHGGTFAERDEYGDKLGPEDGYDHELNPARAPLVLD